MSTLHRGDTTLGEVFIHGVGHFHPENRIDNAFLASLDIGTDDAWIMERVGIRSRRTVLPLEYIRTTKNAQPQLAAAASMYTNAQTGAAAARMALARSGLAPSDIGLVIAGGCSPQHSIPAEACRIAAELGIQATAYDVNSACSSFAVQVHQLQQMRPSALPDYVLVVNVENTTRTVDYRDRRTAVLWGDGSAAAVLSARVPAPVRVTRSVVHSDPAGWNKVVIPAGGHFVQDGRAVQGFAIRKSVATITSLASHLERDRSELLFIGHQANLMMLDAVRERAGISPDRHLHNVEEFGNCGAAGAPGVLSQRWDDLPPACEIALVVVGSGLTWAGLLIDVRRPS
ncbi:MAG TPA: ketoacyl-ACP synthase III [Vicinamibacterales bacterium]|nr:ketoacyl-ACP synthase III [Vicinamibacterales bacterium]HPW21802.1 ketoacyl-ACP synthase III [Vicinamibacterales bacterium]